MVNEYSVLTLNKHPEEGGEVEVAQENERYTPGELNLKQNFINFLGAIYTK